ncbi:hypothetical protein GCM10007382_24210 [Salinibacterium xinjiangense]|uniref:hypothetical protein n=1 Tax=Salinibacterium xinjiangense TaxID=386302 RepID=UPI000BE289CA|nr:hypothetical protein [Salinibacterium xinjiangense]GGL03609.1 hypothetical protein GCM10007382_24210 [Salinibacterium xinjiangense]
MASKTVTDRAVDTRALVDVISVGIGGSIMLLSLGALAYTARQPMVVVSTVAATLADIFKHSGKVAKTEMQWFNRLPMRKGDAARMTAPFIGSG